MKRHLNATPAEQSGTAATDPDPPEVRHQDITGLSALTKKPEVDVDPSITPAKVELAYTFVWESGPYRTELRLGAGSPTIPRPSAAEKPPF
jgi:hypothetical protein